MPAREQIALVLLVIGVVLVLVGAIGLSRPIGLVIAGALALLVSYMLGSA